ncbi:MAG: Fic family protein [Pseudomonadota bacterium]
MFTFLHGLDDDLKRALLVQLRNLWTHTSTAIEGNTLTLGETAFVLEEGLTVSGKPLKDHEEVVGHARAIDILYRLVQQNRPLTESDLFSLHQAVQTSVTIDIYKPVGAWKKEPNSTVAVVEDRQVVFEYGRPEEIPGLMADWFRLYREVVGELKHSDRQQALMAYAKLHVAFVRIHPFFDGNGRLARLISNLPVLKSGLPPILIARTRRKDYIDALSLYHFSAGQVRAGDELLKDQKALEPFYRFCEESWKESLALVDAIRQRQKQRYEKQE